MAPNSYPGSLISAPLYGSSLASSIPYYPPRLFLTDASLLLFLFQFLNCYLISHYCFIAAFLLPQCFSSRSTFWTHIAQLYWFIFAACSPSYFASALNAQCSLLNVQCSMLNAQCSMLSAHALQYIAWPRLTNVCLIADCTAYTAADEGYSSDCWTTHTVQYLAQSFTYVNMCSWTWKMLCS